MKLKFTLVFLSCFGALFAQNNVPSETDLRIYDIIDAVSADRIEQDVRTLAGFGTRNTFSLSLIHI